MCVNVETALASTRKYIRGEREQPINSINRKALRQRQLGLLRNAYSADLITREIRAARRKALVEDKVAPRSALYRRENRYPSDKRGPSVLSREKLKMLQQIRNDNAANTSQKNTQNDIRACSAPAQGNKQNVTQANHEQRTDSVIQSKPSKPIVPGESIPAQSANEHKEIMKELRERSKYLPALMKEFKRLHLNFGSEVCPPVEPHASGLKQPDENSPTQLADATCATIISAIKAAKQKGQHKRAVSAPKGDKPTFPSHKLPTKPSSSIPAFRNMNKHIISTGTKVGPGVMAVYNHIPAPPPKDYRVHWNRRPSTDSVLIRCIQNGDSASENCNGRIQSRCRNKTVPAWRGRVRCIGTVKRDGESISLTSPGENPDKYLLCSQINLTRSKLASKSRSTRTVGSTQAMIKLSENSPSFSRTLTSVDGYDVTRPDGSVVAHSRPTPAHKERKKRRRSVRFSDEKDKVFEYSCEEPIGPKTATCVDAVINYKNTMELRGILDAAFDR